MTSPRLTVEPKKRSRRFYIVILAAALLAIIISVLIFELSSSGQPSYGPGPVEIEVVTGKPFYLQNEETNFTIYVNNEQDWPVPHPLEVRYLIQKDGFRVDGWRMFINHHPNIPTFPPHSRTVHSPLLWDQKVYLNETLMPAPPGNYTIGVSFEGLVYYGDGGSCIIEVRPNSSP